MVQYSVDETAVEKQDRKIRLKLRGWALWKSYDVVVMGDGMECGRYASNLPRYDVCYVLDLPIEDNLYGFDLDEEIEGSYDVLEFFIEKDKERIKVGEHVLSEALVKKRAAKEKRRKLKNALSLAWNRYHFLVPPSVVKGWLHREEETASTQAVYHPEVPEEYRTWLSLQPAFSKGGKKLPVVEVEDVIPDVSGIDGEYVILKKAGCTLYEGAETQFMEADLCYSDSDRMDENGLRYEPRLKPDWSYDTLRGFNYIGNVFAVRKDLLKEYAGQKMSLYRLLLELSDRNISVKHVQEILFGDTEPMAGNKDEMERYLSDHGIEAAVEDSDGYTYVKYALKGSPKVSVIVPTKDCVEDLEVCVKGVLEKSSYRNVELVIVDNNSEKEETAAYLSEIQKDERVKVLRLECPFNFSYINNEAVKQAATGEYLVLLNNDTEVMTADWLEQMLSYAQLQDVGSVGIQLWFFDDTIQHAGIIMGKGGVAGHAHYMEQSGGSHYWPDLSIPYDVTACTAACLMISREKFEEVGGLTEAFTVANNDVDLGLKLDAKGYRNVFLPGVVMHHYESKSRGLDLGPEKMKRFMSECRLLKETWPGCTDSDRFYNDGWSKARDYELR